MDTNKGKLTQKPIIERFGLLFKKSIWHMCNQNCEHKHDEMAMEIDQFWTEKWIKVMKHVIIVYSIIYFVIYSIYLYFFIYNTF